MSVMKHSLSKKTYGAAGVAGLAGADAGTALRAAAVRHVEAWFGISSVHSGTESRNGFHVFKVFDMPGVE